ncbi:hypothetical protein HETIRDRAFT_453737 [Heterobasidion irregulare TC 32-1]|uniref:NADH:flavin oxidoreductase/NADH oxidase N-terminal domain-containing protein n=1 Tax=Heterobasidion irregulare (strain TC 32-1) TaxID=747525 RepID=W4K2K7_HETIT|nr:uncharacterized protein HETIRDRAFT_453737 [Heterobasidion irregulare TC 32-1]ETW79286.1 hypothetical protein HETIRDRAFT_453737 [Heterobasidion irregulare TC 32-1]
MSSADPKLFHPIRVGNINLQHRIVLAPLTRCRANAEHVHGDYAVDYYSQRASVPGTLLITEATFIAPQAGGNTNVPGIWSDEQVEAWKKVTDAVHVKGSFIYLQLWALGRAADPTILAEEDPSFPYVSSGNIQMTGAPYPPRPLTIAEVKEYVQLYATAASNAVHRAGFDGVEIHNGNGYLPDQFLQDTANNRTDEYGGSIENRARFSLEVVDAVAKAVGEKVVGIRFSPWAPFQDMRMADPIPTFSHLITAIRDRHPEFGYVHLVEPRISGDGDSHVGHPHDLESNDIFRALWGPRPYLTAGGYNRSSAIKVAEEKGGLIVFGRHFLANPDLPLRLRKDLPLTPYHRETFYHPRNSPIGYTDYPFTKEEPQIAGIA